MVLPGVYVSTVPTSYVVDSVVVVVTGAVVVRSVVVVLVCAHATGAISAQATVMMLLFIIPSLICCWICLDPDGPVIAGLAEIGLAMLDQAGQAGIRSKLTFVGVEGSRSLYLVDCAEVYAISCGSEVSRETYLYIDGDLEVTAPTGRPAAQPK